MSQAGDIIPLGPAWRIQIVSGGATLEMKEAAH
jgi:hypothetical protein